jgi:hypothetical protein
MRLCILTTSYPRFPGDDASIFVKRLTDALAKQLEDVQVIVPLDAAEPAMEEEGNVSVLRFRYGLFRDG